MVEKEEGKTQKKEFDCVEMKRKAQELHYEKTKHMNREEKYAYWKEQEADFIRRNNLKRAA